MKTTILLLIPLLSLLITPLWSQPSLELQTFASGFSQPIGIVNAGDERLFVIQQRGLIRTVNPDGTIEETPFLNLSGSVSQSGSETGLLGLAFHPHYADNGYFYVNYTRASDNNTVVSRFSRDQDHPNLADPESEKQLMTVTQPYSNHNGGQLLFGPDGYLYIALGDGGSGGDPQNYAQNPASLLGKMLRIDVDVEEGEIPYGIPSDNPFIEDASTLNEIWALGLRNHWRNSFDRLTGDLWIADVGQNAREEINFQPASGTGGENYGWRCYEGFLSYNQADCNDESFYTFPVFDYGHQGSGCSGSVTGGYVYRGALFNGMYGHYFFADYCTGNFYHIQPSDDGFEGAQLGTFDRFQYASFGEDNYGELYVVLRGAGEIRKVVETSECAPVAQILEVEEPVDFESGGTVLLEALYHPSLNYQWIKNGDPMADETEPLLLVVAAGSYSVMVTNPGNSCSSTSDPITITQIPTSAPLEKLNSVQVHTNYAEHSIFITNLPANQETIITLIDLNGRTVFSTANLQKDVFTINTQGLARGLYLIRIQHGSEVLVKKAVIR